MGNLGGKPSEGFCGRPKIDGAVPIGGHPANPLMLKAGGKFAKFGGGSCDILTENGSSLTEKYNNEGESKAFPTKFSYAILVEQTIEQNV